jgi:hypothetical protein
MAAACSTNGIFPGMTESDCEIKMIFKATAINDAFIINVEKIGDERGFFGRVFCRREFEAHGIDFPKYNRLILGSVGPVAHCADCTIRFPLMGKRNW